MKGAVELGSRMNGKKSCFLSTSLFVFAQVHGGDREITSEKMF